MSGLLAPSLFVLALATAAAADDTPSLRITTRRADDQVVLKTENGGVTVSIRSPSGIGRAVIERGGEKWPDAVVLRLHLKGLEKFLITNGDVKIEASASIQAGKAVVRVWKDGKEDAPLDARSPFWLDIRVLGGDGTPAKEFPLKAGYFEARLPKALFDDNPRSITVHWIDFYRN